MISYLGGYYIEYAPVAEPPNLYAAANAVDDTLDTAWCVGKKPAKGESIRLRFAPTAAAALFLFNGYGRTRELYYANNRIRKVQVKLLLRNGRTKTFESKVADSCAEGDSRICQPGDKACEARVEQTCYVTGAIDTGADHAVEFPPKCLTGVDITILEVERGKKFDDTCVADLKLARSTRESQATFERIAKSCQ